MNGRQRFEGPPGAPTVALQFIPWDDHTNDPVFSNVCYALDIRVDFPSSSTTTSTAPQMPVNGTFLLAPRASEAASTRPERVATGDGVDVLPNAYDTRTPSNLSFAGAGVPSSSATSNANACSDESASMASAEELDQFILTEGLGEEEGLVIHCHFHYHHGGSLADISSYRAYLKLSGSTTGQPRASGTGYTGL